MNSQRFTLNKTDMVIWGKMTLAFFAPTVIIFFSTLLAGKNVTDAITPSLYSLYASAIYLAKRWQDK